ncbi:VCBS repeat-containing protein [Roseibaca sp. V10]|uniref:VCBS repeat-containing protein n=1 Tax=Roseinatronobacter domitianus TaxID=2940293 RepID=A0ABT0LX94_9RHOB|nr:VCBS repeat-containing protein [Roseibaca domitiana]MCL1627216.1 VCBS repeat-containing protein [Roseibaca domitiana]
MWRFVVCLLVFAAPASAQEIITGARYVTPSAEYGHGALPDGEFAGLEVTTAQGSYRVRLEGQVFEDTAPRLADLDGDGAPEVVTVVSIFDQGAQVMVWGLRDGALAPLVWNTPIGTRHRWLAIAGIADLDGDGRMEIAYVDRPHLARVLRVIRVWRAGESWRVEPVASADGHTNHRYGAPNIEGGVFDCGQGLEIVTADREWRRVLATRLVAGRLQTRDIGAYTGPDSLRC